MALEKTPDMEGLTPAERAAIYKQRAAAAGIGRAPAAAAAPATPSPAPPKQEAAPPPPPAPTVEQKPAATAAPPPPPPKPTPPPPPEPPKVPTFVQRILDTVPESSWQWRHGYAEIKVSRDRLLESARSLRDSGFDYLSFISEVDWRDRFELVYHLFCYDYAKQPLGVILRTELPRDGLPEVPSLTAVWPGAEYMEREAFEMMGIHFLGHPDLRKMLLPDDFRGYPMRKDYETDWEYITVKQLVRELNP